MIQTFDGDFWRLTAHELLDADYRESVVHPELSGRTPLRQFVDQLIERVDEDVLHAYRLERDQFWVRVHFGEALRAIASRWVTTLWFTAAIMPWGEVLVFDEDSVFRYEDYDDYLDSFAIEETSANDAG